MIQGSARSAKGALAVAALGSLVILTLALVVLDLPPELVLIIVAAGIAIPFLVMRPDLGVLLFVASIYIEDVVYVGRMTSAVKMSGAMILAGWLLRVAMDRRLNLRIGPVILLLVVFLGWNALSVFTAMDANRALLPALTYIQLAGAMCMIASVVDSVAKIRAIFRVIVVCTTAAATHGMVLYFMGLRPNSAGLVLNRNGMALDINIAIVCAYFLYQMSSSGPERLWLMTALPALFLGLALTFSRTGFITLLVAFVLISYRLAKGRAYLTLGATLTMLVFVSSLLPSAFYKRVESIVPTMTHQEETFGTRVDLWEAGIKMIRDHPITGVGLGNFGKALVRYGHGEYTAGWELSAHNTFVGIATDAGIPALILFLLLWGAAIRGAIQASRTSTWSSPALGLEAIAVELCLVVIMVSGLSNDTERLKFLYIFFGLAISVRQLSVIASAEDGVSVADPRAPDEDGPHLEPARTT